MKHKASLVIMAAGMGSRYGGAKQIDPVDDKGHVIIDFSVFDAIKAGFSKIIFVIKPEMQKDIEDVVGNNVAKFAEVCYAYQTLDKLPEGFSIPEGRQKPWGTAHAVMCALEYVNEPFAVINADDYYGKSAFKKIFDYITASADSEHAMVAYRIKNTVTENGSVSRGVCSIDENGFLEDVVERLHIEKRGEHAAYTLDGENFIHLDKDTPVSMNMWGFKESISREFINGFPAFLNENLKTNPLKCEYFLPSVVKNMMAEKKGSVKVLTSEDKWHGVTYKEDKQEVVDAIAKLKKDGEYPEYLWK